MELRVSAGWRNRVFVGRGGPKQLVQSTAQRWRRTRTRTGPPISISQMSDTFHCRGLENFGKSDLLISESVIDLMSFLYLRFQWNSGRNFGSIVDRTPARAALEENLRISARGRSSEGLLPLLLWLLCLALAEASTTVFPSLGEEAEEERNITNWGERERERGRVKPLNLPSPTHLPILLILDQIRSKMYTYTVHGNLTGC